MVLLVKAGFLDGHLICDCLFESIRPVAVQGYNRLQVARS